MNTLALRAVVLNELRLRLHRWSTLALLGAVAALSWSIATDWHGGMAMFVVGDTRVRMDSAALAMARTLQMTLLTGLAGFYVARGRIADDVRSGIGSVIATTPVSDAILLGGRWLATVVALYLMVFAATAGALASHYRYADAALELLPYARTYLGIMLPGVLFAASAALLCDAWARLTGRLSDVAWFVLWMGCAFAMEPFVQDPGASRNPLQLIDFAGHGTAIARLAQMFDHREVRIGGRHSFDPALAPVTMPGGFWSWGMLGRRLACAALGVLPLWFAIRLFHRYSPDLLVARAPARFNLFAHLNTPLIFLNRLSRPLLAMAGPALERGARWPGLRGQVMAEIRLTLLSNPVALPALLVCAAFGAAGDEAVLFLFACWGVLISDIGTRDGQCGCADVSATAPGGAPRRYARQLLASMSMGLALALPVLVVWLFSYPLGVAALFAGLFLTSAGAALLALATGTSRTFLVLFLFAIWASHDNPGSAALDIFGAHAVTTPALVLLRAGLALLLCAVGYFFSIYKGSR